MKALSSFRKNKSNSFLRLQKRLFSFLGVFLGFSSVVVAQYGCIEYNYNVPVKVITECGTPAKGIKVDIDDKYNYYDRNLVTNDKGVVSIMLYGHHSFNSISNNMAFHDPQGLLKDSLFSILAVRDELPNPVTQVEPSLPDSGNITPPARNEGMTPVNNPQPFDALLFPNPTYGAFSVKLTLPEKGDVTMNIYDLNGKLIVSEIHPSCPLQSTISVNPIHLSQGTYMVQFLHKNAVLTKRIVIQR